MYDFLTSAVAVAFVLGVMILVHEFGHFAAAKIFGVRVEQFAVGFGKRLFGIRRGETDYRVNLLPLGGYVKMSGENPLEARTGDAGEFMSHPRWQRFIIALAGPFMNVVLAVGLMTVVFMVHFERPAYLDQPANVGYVLDGSPAAKAGIQSGDRIAKIDGQPNPTWQDVIYKVVLSPGQPLNVELERDGQLIDKKITPEAMGPDKIGEAGWTPNRPVPVAQVDPTMPAEKAGMQKGDLILALDGRPVRSIESLLSMLEQNKTKPATVTVERKGQKLNLQITPVLDTVDGKQQYRLGFKSSEAVRVDKLPFPQAFSKSVEENERLSGLILVMVEKLVQHQIPMQQISGPVAIAKMSGEAARQQGWTPLMELMAGISINLAIFNLLPFPILDGGVILFLAIEGIRRRDISLHIKERIYQVAFVLLVLFAVMVIYNDLAKTIPGLGGRP
ncbi:MAG: RIP metalloprotease RseP [Terriglobales bacterium]